MRHLTAAAAVAALALAGCTTIAPVQRRVDPDTLPSCTKACEQVGMRLSAIVFVTEYGGCVCEPAAPRAAGPAGTTPVAGASGAATGGLVTILAAEAAQRQAQQAQQAQLSQMRAGHR